MSFSVSISETVVMHGECPVLCQDTEATVTYKKYQPLGEQHAYAIPVSVECCNDECDLNECPIASQRVYW